MVEIGVKVPEQPRDEVAMRLSRVLIAMSIALMFSLAGAGAAQGYEWVIEEEELASLGAKESISSSGGTFKLQVPSIGLEIKCTAESAAGEIVEGGTSNYSMTLTGCVVAGAEAVCSVKTTGNSSGTMTATVTTNVVVKEISKSIKAYDEVTPKMRIIISGAECPAATTKEGEELQGKTAAEVPKPGEESTKRIQKFSGTIATESGFSNLSYGKLPATLTGENTEQLSGPHKGQAQKIEAVKVTPQATVVFAGVGPGNARQLTMKNLGDLKVKLTNLEIFLGPYTLTEPAPPCKGKELAKNATCITTIECNIAMSVGFFWVKWDELNAAGAVVGFDSHIHRLSC